MRFLSVLLFCIWGLVAPLPGRAAEPLLDQIALDHGLVRLFAEYDHFVPGQTQYLAVEVTPERGWHTYWFNPGDSGLAPEIDWTLPEGLKTGPLMLPAPVRLKTGDFTNYGFPGTMTMMVPVTVGDLVPGATVLVVAQIRFLLCADICVPYDVRLGIKMPVGTGSLPMNQRYLEEIRSTWPQPWPETVTWQLEGSSLYLDFEAKRPAIPPDAKDLWFYVRQPGLTAHDGVAKIEHFDDGRIRLIMPADATATGFDTIDGIVAWQDEAGPHHLLVTASRKERAKPESPVVAVPPAPDAGASIGWLLALGLAFLGGALLNFMPCVFPVLALKIMAFVRHHEGRARLWQENIGYAAGIVASFLALGGAMMALREAGAAIGWGFQLQEPVVIWGLLVLFVMLGCALALDLSLGSVGIEDANPSRQPGFGRGFATGMLVAVVASPCTAPMMAAALGAALVMPIWQGGLVFVALGVGLAVPMMLVTLVPGLARLMPRPGAWMERLRQAMAFPMLAAALWLLWVLMGQTDRLTQGWLLGLLLLIALILWLIRQLPRMRLVGLMVVLGITGIGANMVLTPLALAPPRTGIPAAGDIVWHPYDPQKLARALAGGQSVFVDATADWCITCLVNERTALSSKIVQERFAAENIMLMRADWTRRDPVVTALLEQHGRAGVPLYVMYHPAKPPIVLPQILTNQLVLEAMDKK